MILALLLVILGCACATDVNTSAYAFTNQGFIRGFSNSANNVKVFLGVPFAAPAQRFKPPSPPKFRLSVFDATKFGNPCPQSLGASWALNEDCLNLNIYAPEGACLGSKLPVLVYWYGGSFIYGANNVPMNQPQQLAKEANVIVVTPNHRLGALGFLYLNEMKQADGYKNNQVNFAMLDMIRALTWVQNNIAYFGGDSKSVTIGGHSSGAFMASFLTTVPQSWSLFSKVLQEEGPLTAPDQAYVYQKEYANIEGHKFATVVGCTDPNPNNLMACLANADISVLAQAWQPFVLLPVVDGDLFLVTPEVALTNASLGLVKKAPTFMISVPTPGSLFVNRFLLAIQQVGWNNFLLGVFGPQVGPLMGALYSDAIYGPPNDASLFARASTLIGDMIWLCPLRRHASYYLAFTSDIYVAQWNVRGSFQTFPEAFGVVHGTTVPFIFGNAVDTRTQTPGTFTPAEALLSKKIIKAVGKFMRTGNPGPEYPKWTPELHAEININNITQVNPMDCIRTPPAGQLPPGIPADTRCGVFDVLFYQLLSGQISGQFAEQVAEKFNIWEGVRF